MVAAAQMRQLVRQHHGDLLLIERVKQTQR
jgi:hypothetical protein